MSSEIEVLHFLYQLVLTVKPLLVVETGTYHGDSALSIGRGLRANGHGVLVSFEIDKANHLEAQRRVLEAGLEQWVDLSFQDSRFATAGEQMIDILFCDSDPPIRADEIKHFWPQLGPHSLVLVHDVNTGLYLSQRQALLDLGMHTVFLPTPRGLAICQKRPA